MYEIKGREDKMEQDSLLHNGKLVVINDAPKFANYLRELLEGKGYICRLVDSSVEAKRLLQHEGYDAIVYGHEFFLTEKTHRKITEEESGRYGGEFIIIDGASQSSAVKNQFCKKSCPTNRWNRNLSYIYAGLAFFKHRILPNQSGC